MKRTIVAALALLIGAAAPALADVSVTGCSVRAGSGTGKDLALGSSYPACETAVGTMKDGSYTILVRAKKFTPAPAPAPAPDPATVALTPPLPTTEATVSFAWAQTGTGKVWCHLDAYAPIDCSARNPFVVGSATPLKAGQHKVEFWMSAKGDGSDLQAVPLAAHTWTVPDAAPVPQPPASDPAPTPTPTPVGALPMAPLPVPTAVSGSGAQWDGKTPISWNGTAMMAPATDPNGSGRTVNLHRVVKGAPSIWGGVRSEQLWLGKSDQELVPGRDIWMAFAAMRKADETFPTGVSPDDQHLMFQTHTPQSGDTQPDIAFFAAGQGSGYLGWRAAYNTSGTIDSQGWMHTEGNPWLHKEPLPAPGQWYRYVVHMRPGYLTSHNPLIEIWRAKPGEGYEKIVNYASYNTYNTAKTGAGYSYPRIGLYKWTDSTWTTNTVAWYLTPLYFGVGADLLEAGKAALSGL